jgi:alginate O-acetyltransferase complex protein AlgJ
MPIRSRGALVGALTCALLVPLSALDAAAGQQGHQHAAPVRTGPSLNDLDALGSTGAIGATGSQRAATATGFLGADGLFYDYAPLVIGGYSDEYFLGQDFDVACADGGKFAKGMKQLGKLAKLIASAGKRVVFTVAPNKSSVDGDNVYWPDAPHSSCGSFGVADQNRTLDSFPDRRYVAVRKSLADDPRDVYWKTDAHWTTVGSSVVATEIAARLDKRLARRQKYQPAIRTELGDIYQLLGLTTPETASALLPDDGVTVTQVGKGGFDPVNGVSFEHSWASSPARRTLAGKGLVVGDSFSYLGLEALRPLFAKGTFLWVQPNMLGRIAAGIADADTVVIEVVQRFVSTSILGTRSFRAAVRKKLQH